MGEDSDRLILTPNPEEYDLASDDTLFAIITNVREPVLFYICYPDIWLEQYQKDKSIGRWKVRGDEECASVGKIEPAQSQSFVIPIPPVDVALHPRFGEIHFRFEARLYRECHGFEERTSVIARSKSFRIIDTALIID